MVTMVVLVSLILRPTILMLMADVAMTRAKTIVMMVMIMNDGARCLLLGSLCWLVDQLC